MIPGGRDTKVFTGTMDQDTESRYLGSSNYRYLLNARNAIGTQGSFGAIEDVMGNSLVVNPYLPRGTNKIIGSYEDIAGQSCIYFNYNSNGYHGIYRWYANRIGAPNGIIEKIYQVVDPTAYDQFNPNPLNFQENYLITGVNLVDNLLYWTDNYNSPKMINIERANETNKKRKFNLYLNKLLYDRSWSIFANGITFTINVYEENNPVPIASLSFFDPMGPNPTTLQDTVSIMYAAYLADPVAQTVFTMANYYDYVTIEINNPGIYTVEFINNGPNFPPYFAGYVTPENFYPDITNTTFSYAPTSYQLFERIKYPPFCSMDGVFDTNSPNGDTFIYEMTPTSGLATFVNANNIYNVVATGIQNVIEDTGNVLQIGNHVTQYGVTGNGFQGIALAKIKNNSNVTKTVNISVSINTVLGIIGGAVQYYIGPANNPNASNSVFMFGMATQPANNTPQSETGSAVYSIPPGGSACVWASYNNVPAGTSWVTGPDNLYNMGPCIVRGTIQTSGLYNPLTTIFPTFRAAYVYKDNQKSVYGAISKCIVGIDSYKDKILLNFGDKRLKNVNLACDIKKVILSVSLDNNVTWFDFASLDPWQWIGGDYDPNSIFYTGDFNQNYTFDNLTTLIPISPEEAVLPYHNVPLTSKSQEYIDDRIWDGAIVTGYDKIIPKIEIEIKLENTNNSTWSFLQTIKPYSSITRWKRGWKGTIGIVYYDDADRKTAVCVAPVGGDIEIPNYNQPISFNTFSFDPAYLLVAIYNDPPDWATKYHLVRTKDLSQITYLIISADTVSLVDSQDNVVGATFARFIKIDLKNISYYTQNSDKGTIINYTFVSGDRVKFIQTAAGVLYNDNDYEIAYSVGNVIYIVYDGSISPTNGCLLELYTPRTEDEKKLFYEFDTCYAIETTIINGVTKKIHTGNIANQIPNVSPAIIETKVGDVWYRSRQFFYNTPGPIGPGLLADNYTLLISSNTPSDYTSLIEDNNGRVNSEELKGELYQPTAIVFSDRYISNTEINGLAAVQPLNTEQYSTVYGPINKMQVVNNDVLKLVFGNSYQLSIYVSQGVIRQSQGGPALVSVADQVAGNSHIIQRTLGTINAESVIVNDEADMFGYDENEGVVWVASGNGLIQISDRGMKSIFKRYSNERKASGLPSETPAVYDLYHDEYIITFGTITDPNNPANSFAGVTIAYNKQKGGWTSYYSFVPEYYGRVRDYVVSFKDGDLWVHDRNQLSKNFYGTQYNRQLTYISNKDFPKVKDYKAVSVNGIGANSAPTIRILPFQGYLAGMLSSLSQRFFQTLEGVQYAYFQKDKLSPGFGGNQLQALANGRNLKGQVIEVTLENTDTAKSIIYSSDIVYFYSEHS